eukprot:3488126-Pyramimonas_sp.AAC.1
MGEGIYPEPLRAPPRSVSSYIGLSCRCVRKEGAPRGLSTGSFCCFTNGGGAHGRVGTHRASARTLK